jgi:hypothetical protein
MHSRRLRMFFMLAAVLSIGTLACQATDLLLAQVAPTPTPTRTRTPRPTITPIPTDTPTPTITPTPTRTATATPRPATPRPPTAKPPTAAPQPVQPPVSQYEFHVNPPTCVHAGDTYIKGTVYLNKNDPSQRYQGAIVALGAPDGSTIYAKVLSEYDGTYTFILQAHGASPGNWGLWLVTPSDARKSDIGGPINTNNLGPDSPNACWAGSVDFWK